jgi:hypothetical protein
MESELELVYPLVKCTFFTAQTLPLLGENVVDWSVARMVVAIAMDPGEQASSPRPKARYRSAHAKFLQVQQTTCIVGEPARVR